MKYKIIRRVDNALVGTYDTCEDAWKDLVSFVGTYRLGHGFEYQLLPNEDEYMEIDEALQYLGISRPSLDIAVNSDLPYILTAIRYQMYFKKNDLTRWMQSRATRVAEERRKEEERLRTEARERLEKEDRKNAVTLLPTEPDETNDPWGLKDFHREFKSEQAVATKNESAELLSLAEASEYTGYSKSTINLARQTNRLPAVSAQTNNGTTVKYLFNFRDLDAWMEEQGKSGKHNPKPWLRKRKHTSNSATI